MSKYNVRIKTKNITYAGTDSTVAIRFSGPDGASGMPGNQWVKLDNVGNDFQPGAEDTYEVEGNLNGPITEVSLALDGSDEWRPDWVIIEDVSANVHWKTDFSDVAFSNSKATKTPSIMETLPVLNPGDEQRERALAKAWLQNFSAGIVEVAKNAGRSTKLLVPALIGQLEKIDFPVTFVSVGGALSAGAGFAGSVEGGGVFGVTPSKNLGSKVANYFTLARGWDLSPGIDAGAVVAAWNVNDVKLIGGPSVACHLNIQAGVGLGVSAIYADGAPDAKRPTGVQVALLVGFDAISVGQMDPYTWIWPV